MRIEDKRDLAKDNNFKAGNRKVLITPKRSQGSSIGQSRIRGDP